MQGRHRDADIESEPVDTEEEGPGSTDWESSTDMCALPQVKQIARRKLLMQRAQLGALWPFAQVKQIASRKLLMQGAQLGALWRPRGGTVYQATRRFQEEGTLIHADVWQKPAHHYKTSKNKLKKKKPENLE